MVRQTKSTRAWLLVIELLIDETYALLNEERVAVGVAPLVHDYELDIMAGYRSAENADCDFFMQLQFRLYKKEVLK